MHVKSSTMGGIFNSFKRAVFTSPAFDYQGRFEQQGGCMIVGPGPILHFFHADKHARDHCPINFLLKKVDVPAVNFPPNPYCAKAV